jgi:hypothetical protein
MEAECVRVGLHKCYASHRINYEENIGEAMQTIFRDRSFAFPSPKLIIAIKGGLNHNTEIFNDFNEKQFSASVARLLLDIGKVPNLFHSITIFL